ncbi:MAG: hypothetical protein JWM42_3558, partial [Burkholderia sp.]|nr:hypothetical protein [Burkholderia sp.]
SKSLQVKESSVVAAPLALPSMSVFFTNFSFYLKILV